MCACMYFGWSAEYKDGIIDKRTRGAATCKCTGSLGSECCITPRRKYFQLLSHTDPSNDVFVFLFNFYLAIHIAHHLQSLI